MVDDAEAGVEDLGAVVAGAFVVEAGGLPHLSSILASMHAWNNSAIPLFSTVPRATSTPVNHSQRKMIGPASYLTPCGNSNAVSIMK
jgi:hypothetical protein